MTTNKDATVLSRQQGARRQFLTLVEDVRPELHRYCARMTGSVAQGEDVVQDALARAYFELPEHFELPTMRLWLFRIAHNAALDHLRRYDQRMGEALDETFDVVDEAALHSEDAVARDQAVPSAVGRFLELAPAQRSCVILKDVLNHSLTEVAQLLGLTVPAVKAALHRGRERLRALEQEPRRRPSAPPVSPGLTRYVTLFRTRDWAGLSDLLAEDVRLDLVSRAQVTGRERVNSRYFTNYAALDDWRPVAAWLDAREVIAVFRRPEDPRPGYFIEVAMVEGRVAQIRDFRYVPYVANDAAFELVDDERAADTA